MNYRDDREALRNEVESLQQELEKERSENERLAAVEQRLEAARREMREAESELARVRPRSRRPPVLLFLVGGTMLLAAAGAGFFLTVRSAPPPRIAAPPPPPPVVATPTPEATVRPAPVPAPEVPPSETKPAPKVHATWSATVTRARGVALAPGARCTIEADVVPDSSGMHVDGVEVRCGATKLYSERDPLSGMSMVDSGATQRPWLKGSHTLKNTYVYGMAFSDHGDRGPSRNQAQLDSTAKVGKVWSDNLPEMRVDLAIQPDSGPVDTAVRE